MLLMNIKMRFGKVAPEIEKKINSINDTGKIRELFVQSFSYDDEFQFNKII